MIFISYASEDRSRVIPFYDLLEQHGLDPWMDCKNILGGQNWDYEIRTALDRSEIVIVFVSENSVDKRGYAQREIRIAIDKYEEKIFGDVYIIPVQLDPGEFPHLLKGIQFIKADQPDVYDSILKSISAATHNVKQKVESAQSKAEVRWVTSETKVSYSGIPGYSTTVNRLTLSSTKYSHLSEISDHVNGTLAEYCMNTRESSLSPDPTLYNLMQDEWKRTNTFDAVFASAQVVGRVISIRYIMNWYSAGAAHPIHAPKFFNYLLDPIHYLRDASSLFSDKESALSTIQYHAERGLIETLYNGDVKNADINWIKSGTESWKDFSNFSIEPNGILFQFSSYQVACYASGLPSVTVSFEHLTPLFTDTVLYALNLYRQ